MTLVQRRERINIASKCKRNRMKEEAMRSNQTEHSTRENLMKVNSFEQEWKKMKNWWDRENLKRLLMLRTKENESLLPKFNYWWASLSEIHFGAKKLLRKSVDWLIWEKPKFINGDGIKRKNESKEKEHFIQALTNSEGIQSMAFVSRNL